MKKIEKIQKEQAKKSKAIAEVIDNQAKLTKEYTDKIEKDPIYSLDVDPMELYSMTDKEKAFVKMYVQTKNIQFAGSFCGFDEAESIRIFEKYSVQREIERINKALLHRRFSSKILSIDEISGWLSTLITDENVPISDRLKTMDKVNVAKMLIDLNRMKAEALLNPVDVIDMPIEDELKDLSVKTIKNLLAQKQSNVNLPNKDELIKELGDGFSDEELNILKNLSVSDLLNLIDMKGGK